MKASAKFLSVLLVVVMCIGFVPTAYATGSEWQDQIIIGSPASSTDPEGEVTPTAAPAPGGAGGTDGPEMFEETAPSPSPSAVPEDEPEDEISVTTAEGLRAAVDEVKAFGTVYVKADIDLSMPLQINKSLTLDMDGVYTLTFSGSGKGAIIIGEDVDQLSIVNGEILAGAYGEYSEEDGGGFYGYASVIYSEGGGLYMNGVNVEGGGALIGGDTSNVGIDEGTFDHDPSDYIDPDGYEVSEADGVWTVTEKAEETDPSLEGDGEEPEKKDEGQEENKGQEGQVVPGEPEEGDDDLGIVSPDGKLEGKPGAQSPEDGALSGSVEVADAESFKEALQSEQVTEIVLTGDVTVDADGEALEIGVDLNLGDRTLKAAAILINTEQEITISGGKVDGKITNTGKLTLDRVNVSGVENSANGTLTVSGCGVSNGLTVLGGSVSVVNSAVDAITVSGGDVTVSDGADVRGDITVQNDGALTLTGSAQVKDVVMNGGTLTVAEGSTVKGGLISLKASCAINIYSGDFENVQIGGAVQSVMSEALGISSGIEVSGELLKGTIQLHKKVSEKLLAPGFMQTRDFMVMNLNVTKVDGAPKKTGTDGKEYVIVTKGSTENKTVFDLTFEGDTSAASVEVTEIEYKSGGGSTTGTLRPTDDYTYDKANKKVTLKSDSETIKKIEPGVYTLTFKLNGVDANPWIANVIVCPKVTPDTVQRYVRNSGKSLDYTFQNTVDEPESVEFSTGQDVKGTPLMRGAEGYEWSSGEFKLTIKDTFLNKLSSKDEGVRYFRFCYDGVTVTVPVKIVPPPSVSPDRADWYYNGDDLVFRIGGGDNAVEDVKMGESLLTKNSDYTLSADGRTVTIKASYLKHLINTGLVDDYGDKTFTFVTTDGEVSAKVTLLPALWPVDGDAHRRGSSADLVFEASGPINTDVKPKVGEIDLTSDQYSISGNKITLKAAFMNEKLHAGNTYKLTVKVGTMDTITHFKITGTNSGSGNNPQTGDPNNALVWLAVLALSGGAAVALLPRKKKERE